MDPFSLLFGLVGAGLNIAGAVTQRAAEEKAFDANSRELQRAAKLADAQAVDALRRGSLLAGQARTKGTRVLAEQQIAFASSGVDASVGTPAQLANETGAMSEFDAQTLENNAAREAWGHKEVGRGYGLKRQQLAQQHESGGVRTGLQVGGSLLSAGGAVANAWRPKGETS